MKMKPETKPIVKPPRKVPHPMLNHLKDALDSLCKQGIIEPVTETTEWVNSLVILEKKSGDLRVCINPRSLNQGIQREHYPMRTVEDVAVCLAGKKVFSVLDAGQAFYQIRVTEATARLLMFNSAFGQFKYTRMPFGISSASEVVRNDILIAGKDVEEHDAVLRKVLDRALEKGLGLNSEKCHSAVDSGESQRDPRLSNARKCRQSHPLVRHGDVCW